MSSKIQQLFLSSVLYAAAAIIMVSAQEEEGSDMMWYQWQSEALVAQCPTDSLPPFRLDDPTTSSRKDGVILIYDTQIPDTEWVEYMVADQDCATVVPSGPPGNTTVPLHSTLTVEYSDYVTSSATARLRLEMNPPGLQPYGALFYTETSRTGVAPNIVSEGDARVCVRMAIWNGPPNAPDSQEVTWIDTVVLFPVEMTVTDESYLDFTTAEAKSNGAGRHLRIDHNDGMNTPAMKERTDSHHKSQTPHDRRRLMCQSTWGIDVLTCPPDVTSNSSAITLPIEPNNEPIPKNLPVRLCVQPNEVTRAAGVTMKGIQGLYYTSPAVVGVVQTAVEGYKDSLDGRTAMTCGEEICVVETTMDDAFHGNEVIAGGRTIFQPSVETVYNQIVVDFELPIQISSEALEESGSSSASLSMALMLSSLLAGLLVGTLAAAI